MMQKISLGAQVNLAVLKYPLAPESGCLETVSCALAAYDLLCEDVGARNVVILGDSAGGGLALVLAQHIAAAGKPAPAALVLLSPWLDVAMTHRGIGDYADRDILLTPKYLISCGRLYARNLPLSDPRVSPVYSDQLSGLPPLHIFVGGGEIFYPDCLDYYKKLEMAGQSVKFYSTPDMPHVWQCLPIPEARTSIAQIASIIREGTEPDSLQ